MKMTKEEENFIIKQRIEVEHFLDEYYDLCKKYNMCLTEFTFYNDYANLHVFPCNLHVPPYREVQKEYMLLKFDAKYKQWYDLPMNEKEKAVMEEYDKSYPFSIEVSNMSKLEDAK